MQQSSFGDKRAGNLGRSRGYSSQRRDESRVSDTDRVSWVLSQGLCMDSSQKGLEEWSGTEGCLGTSLVCHDSKDATAIWLPRWLSGKESACQCSGCKRCRFYPWVRKIPWRKKQQPTSVFLLGKSHGQRSLVGYSPWGHRVRHNWAHTHTLPSSVQRPEMLPGNRCHTEQSPPRPQIIN